MIPAGSELKLCCVNCEEAIDEIGQLRGYCAMKACPP